MTSSTRVCGVDIFLVAYFAIKKFRLMSSGRQLASHNKLFTGLDGSVLYGVEYFWGVIFSETINGESVI